MQHRYVGDIGDFGKYSLLKALAGDDLTLGIHWCLNEDEERNTDGGFISYPRLRHCDPLLHDALQRIVNGGHRHLTEIEKAAILPARTCYFSDPLSSKSSLHRVQSRVGWNTRAFSALSGADLVFLDPDNGLTSSSETIRKANGAKYVHSSELVDYLRRGQSIVVYDHADRRKGGLMSKISIQFELLRSWGANGFGRSFFAESPCACTSSRLLPSISSSLEAEPKHSLRVLGGEEMDLPSRTSAL